MEQAERPSVPERSGAELTRAKTILVVDDDEQNRKLLRLVLRRASYHVIEAPNGMSGVELAKTHRPHLILMDVRLPDINGLEATRRIKGDPAVRDTPVLAVSAYAMDEDIQRAMQAGCVGYLTKPLDLKVLRREVSRHLGEREQPT